MYVPKSLRPDHPLVSAFGFAVAQKLVRTFGGEILQPASCRDIYRGYRDRSIVEMLHAGASVKVIAELFGVSDRHVRNVARGLQQERQELNSKIQQVSA